MHRLRMKPSKAGPRTRRRRILVEFEDNMTKKQVTESHTAHLSVEGCDMVSSPLGVLGRRVRLSEILGGSIWSITGGLQAATCSASMTSRDMSLRHVPPTR